MLKVDSHITDIKRDYNMKLADLITVPEDGAFAITITGDPGAGKTSFASTFPKPLFILGENGLVAIPKDKRPPALPLIRHPDDLWEQLEMIADAIESGTFEYETVVFDSVTQLDTLFGQWIVESDHRNPKSLAQAHGGYGAGYTALSEMHRRIRDASQFFLDSGVNVVFIAHSETSTIELPDKDPFTKYVLRLHKKTIPHYVDNVDLVGYMRLQSVVTGGDDNKRGKIKSSGKRELVCHTTAENISKNRYGIAKALKLTDADDNPLYEYIPSLEKYLEPLEGETNDDPQD